MNDPLPNQNSGSQEPSVRSGGWKAFAGCIVLAGIIVGLVAIKGGRAPKTIPPTDVPELAARPESQPTAESGRAIVPTALLNPAVVAASTSAATNRVVSASARELVTEMWEICGIHGPVTQEQAEKFKRHLEELIRGGAASVTAIREFLEKNTDLDFGQVQGGDQLSYSSVRAAFLDALKQLGGPEAQSAMAQILQTSAVPSELLAVANNLETQAPGQYREQILKAAREALEMAAANQLGTNAELGPAYRILNTYSEAGTAEDTAKRDPINFSNAVAMASLPNGQGLQSLLQMAQNPSPDAGGRIVATEMIAQLAGNNSEAFDALMQLAQNAQISNRVWTRLAPILGGDQYQFQFAPGAGTVSEGSTPYTVVNNVTTSDQINQRIGLIDRFLGMVAPDSAAASALLHERQALAGRLSN
jgi:hypothetical protein